MMGIDGTWRRSCQLADVSASGARLIVSGSGEGLNLQEFFLLLAPNGVAYRRCELVRVNGEEIGVRFLKKSGIPGKPPQGERSRPLPPASTSIASLWGCRIVEASFGSEPTDSNERHLGQPYAQTKPASRWGRRASESLPGGLVDRKSRQVSTQGSED